MVADTKWWRRSPRIANVLAILTILTGTGRSRGSDVDHVRDGDPLLDLKNKFTKSILE